MSTPANSSSYTSTGAEEHAHLLNLRGCEHLVQDNASDAFRLLQQAVDLEPRNPVILNNLGSALVKLNRYDDARDAYLKAISADPDYLKPYRNLALLYQLTGDVKKAIETYRFYLSKVADDGEAQHNLGLLYMRAGQKEQAAIAFKAAAQHPGPDTPEVATNLGVGHFLRGNLEQSIECFERALALDTSFIQARYHVGVAYLHQGRFQDSIAALERVLASVPDYPLAKSALGVAYNSARESLKAIEVFEELLQEEPGQLSHLLNLGYASIDAGFTNRAKACFQNVVKIDSRDGYYRIKAQQALDEIRRGE